MKKYWNDIVNGNISNHAETGRVNAIIYLVKEFTPVVTFIICFIGALGGLFSTDFSSPEAQAFGCGLFFCGAMGSIVIIRMRNDAKPIKKKSILKDTSSDIHLLAKSLEWMRACADEYGWEYEYIDIKHVNGSKQDEKEKTDFLQTYKTIRTKDGMNEALIDVQFNRLLDKFINDEKNRFGMDLRWEFESGYPELAKHMEDMNTNQYRGWIFVKEDKKLFLQKALNC